MTTSTTTPPTTQASQATQRRTSIKPLHIAGIGIILLAILYGAFGFKEAFRSYTTSVSEAKESGRSVQLAGFLGSTGEFDTEGRWTFLLEDENGEQVKVVHEGPRPSNFEQATSVVAIGHYDLGNDVFFADDLLVKCPSKYQEEVSET
jgi:cytochrome c-type biogenesis protein CcmE